MDAPRMGQWTQAAIFAGSDQVVMVRWYQVPDDNPAYDQLHAFGHEMNEWRPWEPPVGPGMYAQGAAYAPRAWPCTAAGPPVGSVEDFQQGITALGPPGSPCCGLPFEPGATGGAITPQGGAGIDGSAWSAIPVRSGGHCTCCRPRDRIQLPGLVDDIRVGSRPVDGCEPCDSLAGQGQGCHPADTVAHS